MKINLNLLPVNIDTLIKIPEEYYKDTDIVRLDDVSVKGSINYNVTDDVAINLAVSGNMYLIDAITNQEVKYPYNIKIEEILAESEDENEKYLEKSQNILDIIEFLWENIVLEVPISFTSVKNAHMKGEGWELNSDEAEDDINPQMQKLSELFKGGE